MNKMQSEAVANTGQPPFYASGSVDIDAVRHEIKVLPTSADNYRRRVILLYMWLSALQQQGADTRPFTDVDKRYYLLEGPIVTTAESATADEQALLQSDMATLIDEGFKVMESIQSRLVEQGPIATPCKSDGSDSPDAGDMEAEWPLFQGDIRHTGFSKAPGPRYGRNAWKFPVGLGWYARPVVEDGKIYVTSPGMHTTSLCLDLATGNELWTSTQEHPLFGIYKYPAIASTPLVLKDRIVLREVNSHGGNEGQAKNLVYLDKATGKMLDYQYAGHVDYRTQYAAVATNGKYMVYPFGVHDIYGSPAICQNFNRLICADIDNKTWLWDFNVGDIDALAEPVVTQDMAIVGTMEGYLYARGQQGRAFFSARGGIGLHGVPLFSTVYCVDPESTEIYWTYPDGGGLSAPTVANGRVYIGSGNSPFFYCLDEETGRPHWIYKLGHRVEEATFCIYRDKVFVLAADGYVHAIE